MTSPGKQADSPDVSAALVALSKWIDAGNAHRDPEAILWGRVAKLTEECGEAMSALIGATGQNPRKGVTHSTDDVEQELLDVAVTALGAIEHVRGHDGQALALLADKILRVHERAVGCNCGGGHTISYDAPTGHAVNCPTRAGEFSDVMTVRDPFAALARKWALLAEHSPAGERAALTLMVADLWKTIDEAAGR